MKNFLKYTLVALAGSTLGLTSCGLDEYNPSAGNETVNSFETWKGLATYCYSPLATQLYSVYDFLSVAEGGTDMWLCPSGNRDYAKQLIYYDGLTTNTNASNKLFKQAYTTIPSCNSVIANADKVVGGTEEEKAKIVAEAKTLRAFYNLLLVTYYGPVTLTNQEVGNINTSPVRSTVEDFYKSITTDLKEAAEALDNTPVDGNYARVTKKTALGILARAYAQGAGEGLQEDGKSYWLRAREVAEDIINNSSAYNVYLYDNIDDLWAQENNRNNKEALFIASGANATLSEMKNYYVKNNLFTYTICNPNKLTDLYTRSDKGNYYLGRTNNNTFAPSKYSIDVFDPSWDRRWENTFMTAFGMFSMTDPAHQWVGPYAGTCVTITPPIVKKYGINSKFTGKKIYPYIDMKVVEGGAYNQYVPSGVWPKGETSGNPDKLLQVKNAYVIDYPVALDDNRFAIVMSKEPRTPEEKAQSQYFTLNIDDLYGSSEYSTEFKTEQFDGTNSYQLYPSLIKFNWCYDGSWGSALNTKNGDMMIMRTAEIYLIAAEACQQLGDPSAAARYLEPLRIRATRPGATTPALGNVTEDVIFDEYAREMAGELNRWALLKRHHAFEARLAKYNERAARFFNPDRHYLRPISADFLNQIDNKNQYGDNGYGTIPGKGF
ncbi:RagB/SusD family nutrient uptake outer membrane protein [uncultured Duncaniella sp.]|uniref:RagB/SusD family nutrient uptake outer membrane protein n=1 Tax=uncultured Duncaniella sp. TaxID=2768039 RepID=UPI0025DCEC24|nr:RagB/SusD family nutrient uptake outer membrane protein [uncultured Duncaniella sp.]